MDTLTLTAPGFDRRITSLRPLRQGHFVERIVSMSSDTTVSTLKALTSGHSLCHIVMNRCYVHYYFQVIIWYFRYKINQSSTDSLICSTFIREIAPFTNLKPKDFKLKFYQNCRSDSDSEYLSGRYDYFPDTHLLGERYPKYLNEDSNLSDEIV